MRVGDHDPDKVRLARPEIDLGLVDALARPTGHHLLRLGQDRLHDVARNLPPSHFVLRVPGESEVQSVSLCRVFPYTF